MNVEKARVHYLSMNDNPIVRNKPVLCFDYKGYNLYILEEEKNASTYLLYKDEYGEYWNFYNYSITYDRFDQVINNKLDKYNKEGYIEYCDNIVQKIKPIYDNLRESIIERIKNESFFNYVELQYLADRQPELYSDALRSRTAYREKLRKYREQRDQEYKEEISNKINDKNKIFKDKVNEMKENIISGKDVFSSTLEYFKAGEYPKVTYQNNFLYLFKEYGINIPLKTQGYISNKLYSFNFESGNCRIEGKYFSPHLGKCLYDLKDKVLEENQKNNCEVKENIEDIDITESMF